MVNYNSTAEYRRNTDSNQAKQYKHCFPEVGICEHNTNLLIHLLPLFYIDYTFFIGPLRAEL